VTLERLPALGALDVDVVSTGAITHSVIAADISMKFEHAVKYA
jgi:nicotinate-nucleotide pyrophosphorylase